MNSQFVRAALLAALAVASLQLGATPRVLAAKVASISVGGKVTSISGRESISIDGHGYRIDSRSRAADEIRKIDVGDQVDVVLSGPPGSPETHVVDIHVHANR